MSPSLVILRPDPIGFAVLIEPPLPNGGDCRRTWADKLSAWRYAQGLWSEHRLGFRDETDGNVTHAHVRRGPYGKRRTI